MKNKKELPDNMKNILQKMGYRKYLTGYMKPVGFSVLIFNYHKIEKIWSLAHWFLNRSSEIECWKSIKFNISDLEIMNIADFQHYEATTGREMFQFYNYDASLLVPELTIEERF